ncbi:MAG TPA: DUF5317 family protein [Acidimicrobiales bacterium]|nr:DUF5317 family protein [Acidimicrobiales bacterium]
MTLALAVLLGYLAGRVAGGRLRNIARVPFAGWWLLIPALLDQAFLGLAPRAARAPLLVIACLLLAGWCLLLRAPRQSRPGMYLLSAGIFSNTLAIALNGGMPVSRGALAAAGLPRNLDVSHGYLDKHVAMTSATHLSALGDVIPFRLIHNVISAGDIAMLVGVAIAVRGAMLLAASQRVSRSLGELPRASERTT